MNRDKVIKILGICGATLAMTGLFAFGIVKTVDKGLKALGGEVAGNFVDTGDKLIGVLVTSGFEDINATQSKIEKSGKVYGALKRVSAQEGRINFTTLEGEVFSIDKDCISGTGKYGNYKYLSYNTSKGYIDAYESFTNHEYNIELCVNKNSVEEEVVLYINPIFQDRDNKVYVTDNKCEKVVFSSALGSSELYKGVMETKKYNKSILDSNNTVFNITINYVLPQGEVQSQGLFI